VVIGVSALARRRRRRLITSEPRRRRPFGDRHHRGRVHDAGADCDRLGPVHVVVGLPLRRHCPWSRLIALMLGSVDLPLLARHCARGTLYVLLNEGGKSLFMPNG
jgi:hypothetical protein